mmetsp:Transcript_14463/g.37523  ORF Transcript_14463/g.37523 Transcript_14463/m.37523 type:complete len:84 (+) Transcript_14463:1587-1838(+)
MSGLRACNRLPRRIGTQLEKFESAQARRTGDGGVAGDPLTSVSPRATVDLHVRFRLTAQCGAALRPGAAVVAAQFSAQISDEM